MIIWRHDVCSRCHCISPLRVLHCHAVFQCLSLSLCAELLMIFSSLTQYNSSHWAVHHACWMTITATVQCVNQYYNWWCQNTIQLASLWHLASSVTSASLIPHQPISAYGTLEYPVGFSLVSETAMGMQLTTSPSHCVLATAAIHSTLALHWITYIACKRLAKPHILKTYAPWFETKIVLNTPVHM